MASVPVASIWWMGLKRPPNRPVCGPFWSSGMPSANTRPVRMRLAARTMSSGFTWLRVPIWSSLPQRTQFESFLEASAIAFLPTAMFMVFSPFLGAGFAPDALCVPVVDLGAGPEQDAVALEITVEPLQVHDAVRVAGRVGMQRDRHDLRSRRALVKQPLE